MALSIFLEATDITGDFFFKVRIILNLRLNFLDGMKDGGMVFVSKLFTDKGKG